MKIKGQNYRTIWFEEKTSEVKIIDQTKLPHKFVVKKLNNLEDSVKAIKTMEVRGAPLIGGAAAYGICLALKNSVSPFYLFEADCIFEDKCFDFIFG